MSAVALVGVPRDLRPVENPSERQSHTLPADDLTAAVQRMVGLGIAIRTRQTARGAAADWDPAYRTVTLRPDTSVHAALWLLNDLYLLHTDPAHVSPSVPTPLLRLVQT